MFLKSIEIRGFKSFADKTELQLKSGVTAVVGPNGSGKSNISDAVRWVLGEQSVKSLRGGKMEDVIFAGTQYRKPVGLAQVSLTLDNSDKMLNIEYSDVTISRRLYRSGESEYYINNTQCRLKDVQELFMDTGIGKEGYSIIGQGKIEAVLSGRPEERRGLLEEAAGIVKFKARKEEAEKKLYNTDQNLIRINDILGTYEERLEPLRIESEKAQKFVLLSEELKVKEINMIIYSIEEMNLKINNVKQNMEAINSEIEAQIKDREKIKLELNESEEELTTFEANFSDKRNLYYERKSNYQKINSEIELLNERTKNLKNSMEKIVSELEVSKKKLIETKQKKEELEKLIYSDKLGQDKLEKELSYKESLKNQWSSSLYEKNEELRRYKNEAIEILSTISQNNNEAAILNKEIESSRSKLSGLKSTGESYLNSIKINENTKIMLDDEKIKVSKRVEEYKQNIKSNKNEINSLNRVIALDEKELRNFNAEYSKCEANKNVLVNLEKQYEGYNRSVKNLMTHIDKGIVPGAKESCFVLGDIIKVDQKLEVSIEIALGAAISDVITKDEVVAKTLIEYLKSKNMGRATFLPLNILKSRKLQINEDIRKSHGYIGIASELITYDEVFSPALVYVLGRTVIADSMDNALNIAKKSGYSFKIVTLTGEVVNPGGSLTGGSIYNKSSSIIGRKREIEEFTKRIEAAASNISKITEKIKKNREILKSLDEACLDIMDSIHGENIEMTKIDERINAINIDNSKLTKSYSTSFEEVKLLNEEISKKLLDLEKIKALGEELRIKEDDNNKAIEELEAYLKDNNEKSKNLNEEITAIKIKKAQIDEVVLSKTKEIDRYKNEISEIELKKGQYEKDLKEDSEKIKECENNIKISEESLSQMEDSIKKLEEELKSSETERIKIKEKIKLNSSRLEEINLVIAKDEDQKHRYEVNLARLDTENENLYNKLNDEFKITYAEALNYKEELKDISAYKERINYLNSGIREIGVVNVGSIEEYKEVKEKHSFMLTQKEDLDKAKEELISVIKEMTEKMRSVFKENFKILRENFNETFKELFKGGSADLILAGEDELTCNIEINVQPPGKKLQNINLMSGGEKGLSAIALLFAILKMKPSPFCILDEIEAALDDANVFRYAEFLKKFSERIQFIVITHRKGTMEASDILYGVTMEEKGVSKIVSVDLNENVV